MSSIFDFLALPLELRDEIYDLCYKRTEFLVISCHDMLYQRRSPLTKLQLVNREVKAEYDRRSRPHHRLTAYDHKETYVDPSDPLPVRGHMSKISQLDCFLCIEVPDSDVLKIPDLVNYHAAWITAAVARLPDLARISLRCYLIDYISVEEIDEAYALWKANFEKLVVDTRVVKVDISWLPGTQSYLGGTTPINLMGEWPIESGLVTHTDAIVAAKKAQKKLWRE